MLARRGAAGPLVNRVVDDRASRRFGIRVARAVTAPGGLSDLVGKLGWDTIGGWCVDIDVAWASLVQDDAAVPTRARSGREPPLCGLAVVRSGYLRPRPREARVRGSLCDRGSLVTEVRRAVASRGLGVESAWLRVPVLREGVEPGV